MRPESGRAASALLTRLSQIRPKSCGETATSRGCRRQLDREVDHARRPPPTRSRPRSAASASSVDELVDGRRPAGRLRVDARQFEQRGGESRQSLQGLLSRGDLGAHLGRAFRPATARVRAWSAGSRGACAARGWHPRRSAVRGRSTRGARRSSSFSVRASCEISSSAGPTGSSSSSGRRRELAGAATQAVHRTERGRSDEPGCRAEPQVDDRRASRSAAPVTELQQGALNLAVARGHDRPDALGRHDLVTLTR